MKKLLLLLCLPVCLGVNGQVKPFEKGDRIAFVSNLAVLPQTPAAREGWQRQIDGLVDQIYTINKPLKRAVRIEVIK